MSIQTKMEVEILKKKYDAPTFELVKLILPEMLVLASAEGDPGGFIGDGGDEPID